MKDEKWIRERIKDSEHIIDSLLENIELNLKQVLREREEIQQYELMLNE